MLAHSSGRVNSDSEDDGFKSGDKNGSTVYSTSDLTTAEHNILSEGRDGEKLAKA